MFSLSLLTESQIKSAEQNNKKRNVTVKTTVLNTVDINMK